MHRVDSLITALELVHADLGRSEKLLGLLTGGIEILADAIDEVREELKWIVENREDFAEWVAHHSANLESAIPSDTVETATATEIPERSDSAQAEIDVADKSAVAVIPVADMSELKFSDIRTLRSDFENANPRGQTKGLSDALGPTTAPHFFVIETPKKGKSPKSFLAKVAGKETAWNPAPKAAITFTSYKEASAFLAAHRSTMPNALVGIVLQHALE